MGVPLFSSRARCGLLERPSGGGVIFSICIGIDICG